MIYKTWKWKQMKIKLDVIMCGVEQMEMLMVSLYVKSHLSYKSGSERANILL